MNSLDFHLYRKNAVKPFLIGNIRVQGICFGKPQNACYPLDIKRLPTNIKLLLASPRINPICALIVRILPFLLGIVFRYNFPLIWGFMIMKSQPGKQGLFSLLLRFCESIIIDLWCIFPVQFLVCRAFGILFLSSISNPWLEGISSPELYSVFKPLRRMCHQCSLTLIRMSLCQKRWRLHAQIRKLISRSQDSCCSQGRRWFFASCDLSQLLSPMKAWGPP